MSKLYIDVTQLVHWPGRLTGIPRVMNELSIRFEDHDNVAFIAWDGASNKWFELNFSEAMKLRDQARPEEASIHSPRRSPRELIKDAKVRVQALHPVLDKGIGFSERQYKKLRKAEQVAPVEDSPAFSLKKGDKLFVLWGDWHSQDYIDAVVGAHKKGVTLYQIVYDMLPLVTPQFSGHSTEALGNYARSIYPLCEKVFSISEHTKKDADSWLKFEGVAVPENIVFRLGDDFAIAKPRKPTGFSARDFMLCVGTVEIRKNHALLYYVYRRAHELGIKLPKLVVVGRRGWKTDDIYELMTMDPLVKDQIIFMHDTSDEELAWLYANCKFSVYPSFYEGWGLPIAESIAHGVPCVSSNTSSMTEIAGGLLQYFSPYSVDECLERISELTDAKNLAVAKKRVAKYKPTSWQTTFDQIKKEVLS